MTGDHSKYHCNRLNHLQRLLLQSHILSTMKSFLSILGILAVAVHSTSGFGVVVAPRSLRIQRHSASAALHLSQTNEEPMVDKISHSKATNRKSGAGVVFPKWLGNAILGASILVGATFTNVVPASVGVQPAFAEGSKVIGALKGSGIVFKDTLQIERFEDPKIKGVVLYISNFDRPITEKLGGNFFNDPAYASVACAKTGKDVAIADNIAKGLQGEEVFEESRSLLFKTLRVQRIYDTESNTVVYVSYNTRFDKSDDTNKSRFKSSLCAVNLNEQ